MLKINIQIAIKPQRVAFSVDILLERPEAYIGNRERPALRPAARKAARPAALL